MMKRARSDRKNEKRKKEKKKNMRGERNHSVALTHDMLIMGEFNCRERKKRKNLIMTGIIVSSKQQGSEVELLGADHLDSMRCRM